MGRKSHRETLFKSAAPATGERLDPKFYSDDATMPLCLQIYILSLIGCYFRAKCFRVESDFPLVKAGRSERDDETNDFLSSFFIWFSYSVRLDVLF